MQPRFQSLDASDFSDGNIPVYNADAGKFTPAGGLDGDGVTLRIAQIRTGEAAPPNSTGFNGDFYLDKISGDYYSKDAGTWTLKGNLKGTPGGVGDKGPVGDKGIVGDQGPQGNLGNKGPVGDKGLSGDKGPQGDPGLSGIPSNDANLVHRTDYISPNNAFGGVKLYQTKSENFFFSAHKRFGISLNGSPILGAGLFNGLYSFTEFGASPGQSATLTIDLLAKGEYTNVPPYTGGLIYDDGIVYVSFYQGYEPKSISMRMKNRYGVWTDCGYGGKVSNTAPGGEVWFLGNSGAHFIVEFEITINAKDNTACSVTQLECQLYRPGDTEKVSGFSKSVPETLYESLSWRDVNNDERASVASSTGTYKTKGDIVHDDYARGTVYKSPNGHYWRITRDDNGNEVKTDLGTVAPT